MPLELTGLTHDFGPGPLFTNLTATCLPGRVYAIMGPSGSGKSTLLAIAAGWLPPTAGSVERTGMPVVRWAFQNPHGLPRRTALDHVTLPLLTLGIRRPHAQVEAMALMEKFNLSHVALREFRALSGGEAQRLLLARALASRPDLLLVDEPTAQLDPTSSALVATSFSALAGTGAVVLVATHDPDIITACTDRINLADFR